MALDRSTGMARAFEFMFKSEVEADYFEFGVWRGLSLSRAIISNDFFAKKLGWKRRTAFYAFDSFEGLPALEASDRLESYSVFAEGQYACDKSAVITELREKGCDPERVVFIEGFFQNSLKSPQTIQTLGEAKAGIVHIDCDLYSSARDVLRFVGPRLLDGSLLLFDDWFCFRGRRDAGVQKAFYEWKSSVPFEFTEYFRYSWAGMCFIATTT